MDVSRHVAGEEDIPLDGLDRPQTPPPPYTRSKTGDAGNDGQSGSPQPPRARVPRRKRTSCIAVIAMVVFLLTCATVLGAVLSKVGGHSPQTSPSLLPTPDFVQRTIGIEYGASGNPDSVTVWALSVSRPYSPGPWRGGGFLWRRDPVRGFLKDTDWIFFAAPVVVATAEDKKVGIALDSLNHAMVSQYHDGAWDWFGWDIPSQYFEYDPEVVARPAAISMAPGNLDIVAVGTDGRLAHKHFNETGWDKWTFWEGNFTGEVTIMPWDDGRFSIVCRSDWEISQIFWPPLPEERMQNYTEYPMMGGVEDPSYCSPTALTIEGTQGDGDLGPRMELVVAHLGAVWHKTRYPNGDWGNWSEIAAAFHPPYTPVIVAGTPEAPANLFSRGSDGCIHYVSFDGTAWGTWIELWCLGSDTEDDELFFDPVAAAYSGNGTIDVVARKSNLDLIHLELRLPVSNSAGPDDFEWENLGSPE